MIGVSTDVAPRAPAGLALGALIAGFALVGPWLTPTVLPTSLANSSTRRRCMHIFDGEGVLRWPLVCR